MQYLLDTNICIYIIKKSPRSVLDRLREHTPKKIAISTVTLFELYYGAAKSQSWQQAEDALAKFFVPFSIIDVDRSAAAEAAIIRARLEERGTPIGPYDLLIAGVARAWNMVLVTNNIREFERIENMRLENWAV